MPPPMRMNVYLAYYCLEYSLDSLSKDTREHEHHVGKAIVYHIPQLFYMFLFFWLAQ